MSGWTFDVYTIVVPLYFVLGSTFEDVGCLICTYNVSRALLTRPALLRMLCVVVPVTEQYREIVLFRFVLFVSFSAVALILLDVFSLLRFLFHSFSSRQPPRGAS